MSVVDRPQPAGPSRREFVALGVGALVVASIPLAGRRRFLAQRIVPVMGSLADLTVVHRDRRYAHAAIDAAVERLREVEDLLTRFRDGSDVGRANLGAAREAIAVSPETATVLSAALGWAGRTDGAFDPALGRLITLWDVEHRHAPPPDAAVRRLAGRSLYRGLDLDRWRGHPAVRFAGEDLALDLGGIGAGYGVDQAVATLRDWGIRDAIVNLSGDLYAMGRSENGDPWRVGIRSPDRADRIVTTVEVEDAAVTTSGDYVKFFEYGGRRYHHLIDPASGAPRVTAMHSITVQAADCLTADAAATACFGQDRATSERWLRGTTARVLHTA
ncbi:MAG TPA: FAD:protein FMN transferase [Gemmatimonadales bacterium]|nr:FAD:protein FMN transferase [Gemmatimonadales bacterium]